MLRIFYLSLLTCIVLGMMPTNTTAQPTDDTNLLDLIEEASPTTERVTNAFKSTRVINSQSMEMLGKGVLDFRILHRFGEFSSGIKNLFGLDSASMRLAFDYGITPNIMVGIGRSTYQKELDAFLKYRLLWQATGSKPMPVSLLGVSGITYNTLENPFGDSSVEPTPTLRTAYYQQLIVGRKFSEKLSLQLTPTYVHRNIVQNEVIPHDLFALGFGGRFKMSKRTALVWDYSHVFNRFPGTPTANPLSLGVDIETGGHVFQLHVSNAVGMNERAFLADDNGNWLKGDIRFGFNLSRVFQIAKHQ
jgi:hypothetical protein